EPVFANLCCRKPKSLGGSFYLMIVRDDFSSYTWVYPLRLKSKANGKFNLFFAENNSGSVPSAVLRVRSDDGGEFLEGIFASLRIAQEHTTADIPQLHGVAERGLRLVDAAQSAAR
ncbi:unnamed protein product, partial [Discosporangium mesarthrocarpum]